MRMGRTLVDLYYHSKLLPPSSFMVTALPDMHWFVGGPSPLTKETSMWLVPNLENGKINNTALWIYIYQPQSVCTKNATRYLGKNLFLTYATF